VVVVGSGELGLHVAKYVKVKGIEVYGYDVNIEAIDRAERIAGVRKADDLILICTLYAYLLIHLTLQLALTLLRLVLLLPNLPLSLVH
jgi:phosphoglycerate dehydrogenase-like enzyme